MGMYTRETYCDLKVVDRKGLDLWLDCEDNKAWKEAITIDDKDGTMEIEVHWKIISYWYESFLKDLEELNKFISGEWDLSFETGEEKAIIHFGEGKDDVRIEVGTMTFTDYTIKERPSGWLGLCCWMDC